MIPGDCCVLDSNNANPKTETRHLMFKRASIEDFGISTPVDVRLNQSEMAAMDIENVGTSEYRCYFFLLEP
jgi:hypothetical protein